MFFDVLFFLAWVCLIATVLVMLGGLLYTLKAKKVDPITYARNVNRLFVRRVAFQFAAIFFIALLLWLGGGAARGETLNNIGQTQQNIH